MSKYLYIVESYEKAKKIRNLGHEVIATFGHISEIDVLNSEIKKLNFSDIKIIPKEKRYKEIEDKIKNFNGTVIIGTDPDPEGELIGYTIKKICEKYNKDFIRNPLYGISNKAIEGFVNLNNVRKFNNNFIKYGVSRIIFDKLLSDAMTQILTKELNDIKLGRVQHSILLILDKYKNFYRYNLGNFFFLSKEEFLIDNIEKKEGFKLLKVDSPFNTASFYLEGLSLGNSLFNNNIDTNTLSKYLQKLYLKEYITYPRTDGIVLEEDSYNLLYYKAKRSRFPVINYKLTSQYEKGISPLKLVGDLNGDLAKSFALILRRSIAYLIKPYIVNSYIFKLKTKQNQTYNIELLYDNKKRVSSLYMPEYLIDDLDEISLFELGMGLDEYQIIKLLSRLKIGRPSTYGYIISHLENKELIERTNMEEILLTGLSNDIIDILNKNLPFLTLEFYKEISEDFYFIKQGIQDILFPIKKLIINLRKEGINIKTLDFNNDNNIEIEYKNLWLWEERNNHIDMNL